MSETTETKKTTKEIALEAISRLPDDVGWEDIMYDLYFRERVEIGRTEAREGKTISQDEMMRNMVEWLQSVGR